MATIKRNILANLAGGASVAALTLVITPLQVNILGVDAYGIVGFIATLQALFSVLDFGLSSTVTRELAGDTSESKSASMPLLRTASTVYWCLGLVVAGALVLASGAIARDWFKPGDLDVAVLERGLEVAAIYLALRWPVSLYAGVLAGLQRMDVLNLLKAGVAILRLAGGTAVLIAWRDLNAFLAWTAVSALVEVAAHAAACSRALPGMNWRPGISMPALKAVWGFSLTMNLLGILALAITQLDRVLISKMLPLESLGYYTLAYNTALGISLVQSAISSALMPSLAAAHGANQNEVLLRRYDHAGRAMLFSTGLAVFALTFFGETILAIWVGPAAASGAWQPLALLAMGFWFSACVSGAYIAAIACGRPVLVLKISALSAVPYAAVLVLLMEFFGLNGAAGAWVVLNVGYVLVIVPLVHRAILHIPTRPWFGGLLLPFLALGAATFGGARLALEAFGESPGLALQAAMLVAGTAAYLFFGTRLLGAPIRAELRGMMHRALGRQDGA